MISNRSGNFKKSLYLFLSSLLGSLLFLVIHQAVVVIIFLVFGVARGGLASSESYMLFWVFDYFTLVLVLMLGSWYGIWLGMYWYEKVYEEESHKGFVSHLWNRVRPASLRTDKFKVRLQTAKQTFQEDLKEFEELAKDLPPAVVANNIPSSVSVKIKRGVVRKRTVKKAK
jgi:hypothetical protein